MPQRRFFQIHLSTAVVLMLVAGVLVWANATARTVRARYVMRTETHLHWTANLGWPWSFSTTWGWSSSGAAAESSWSETDGAYSVSNAVCNAVVALAILLAVWQVFEWRIRRRKKQSN